MCLAAFDWNPNERKSLIVSFNRDEFFERPSQLAHYWEDQPHLYGGRDLKFGGSWLTCSTSGRLAFITNFLKAEDIGKKYSRSRGEITTNFCNSSVSAEEFSKEIEDIQYDYSGFNAVLFDGENLVCCSNRDPSRFARVLPAGCYGLSNHLLDTPWPKLLKAKNSLSKVNRDMEPKQLSDILIREMTDPERVSDRSLLPGVLPEEHEHNLSAVFVKGPTYGTRTTDILTFDSQSGFDFTQKTYKTPHAEASWSHAHIPMRGFSYESNKCTANPFAAFRLQHSILSSKLRKQTSGQYFATRAAHDFVRRLRVLL